LPIISATLNLKIAWSLFFSAKSTITRRFTNSYKWSTITRTWIATSSTIPPVRRYVQCPRLFIVFIVNLLLGAFRRNIFNVVLEVHDTVPYCSCNPAVLTEVRTAILMPCWQKFSNYNSSANIATDKLSRLLLNLLDIDTWMDFVFSFNFIIYCVRFYFLLFYVIK